jgi:putative DNA primase/helicase
VTEPSFLESRGLRPAVETKHLGPMSAKKLVSAYGCHVHPLALGTKRPATKNGLKDALPDASAITGNYGVVAGPSQIVAVDLDDYVTDNEIKTFLDTFQLPPTFTLTTGSGGRSMWFRAPEGVELRQRLDFVRGVDIKAGQSYVLGPGNRLHPSEIKKGATGDGEYVFDKTSPKEFAPLPQGLVDALLQEDRDREAKLAAAPAQKSLAELDSLGSEAAERAAKYAAKSVTEILESLEGLKSLPVGAENGDGYRWESGTVAYTAALGSLVQAEWAQLDYDDVLERLHNSLPHDVDHTIGHGIGLFIRAVNGPNVDPRPFPESILEGIELDKWFDRALEKATLVDFRVADGGEAEPSAQEQIEVEERPDDWEQQAWNEEGHVERGKHWAAGSLRWLEDEEVWVTYDQIRWVRKKTAGAYAVQQGMKTARWTEIENYDATPAIDEKTGQPKPKSSERDKFIKMLSDQSTSVMFDRAARSLALSGEVTSLSTDFDRDPMVMGVLNGSVDLRTGALTPPSPESMISHIAPVKYDPTATAPRFMQYLEESLPDPEVRAYLKRVVGYSVSGLTIEQVMFLHHGKTSNGKSVLMDVLGAVLGEYSGGADPKALIETKNEQHSTHIASLAGPRFLQMSETARGARLSDTLIKNITGGDIVTARKLYKENQDLKIVGKIHMVTNHLPHIVASPSTNRRIQLINWPVEIAEDKIDLQLARKIIATELEGVFAWVVEGAIEWWETLEKAQGQPVRRGGRPSGLAMPQQVIVDTSNYLRSEDDILEWMEERTQDSETVESTGNLYQDYRSWAERRGVRNIMTLRAFSTDLEVRGELERGRTKTSKGFKVGLQPLQQNYWGS